MKGIKASLICDEIIDPGSMIVENALRQKYISHVEAFISRKLITRSVESLNQISQMDRLTVKLHCVSTLRIIYLI